MNDFVRETGGKIKVQLIDNEPIYFEAIKVLIADDKQLKESLQVCTAENSSEALLTATIKKPLLIVCDYDMGKHSLNGVEIVAQLKKNGIDSFICIHSAKYFSKSEIESIGADYFLPKPLSIHDLIAIIVLAIKNYRLVKLTEDVG